MLLRIISCVQVMKGLILAAPARIPMIAQLRLIAFRQNAG